MNKIEPSELLHIIKTLQKLMRAYHGASFVMDGSLERIDPRAEAYAQTLRPQIRDTAEGLSGLLEQLMTLPAYEALRREHIK